MISEKRKALDVTIFLEIKIEKHWLRNEGINVLYVTDCIRPSGVCEIFAIDYLLIEIS